MTKLSGRQWLPPPADCCWWIGGCAFARVTGGWRFKAFSRRVVGRWMAWRSLMAILRVRTPNSAQIANLDFPKSRNSPTIFVEFRIFGVFRGALECCSVACRAVTSGPATRSSQFCVNCLLIISWDSFPGSYPEFQRALSSLLAFRNAGRPPKFLRRFLNSANCSAVNIRFPW